MPSDVLSGSDELRRCAARLLAGLAACQYYDHVGWTEYIQYFRTQVIGLLDHGFAVDILGRIMGRYGSNAADVSLKLGVTKVFNGKTRRPQLGVVSGCFDLVHLGHLRGIRFARNFLDARGNGWLCALTLTDEQIRAKKGINRPILCLQERVALLEALLDVDEVLVVENSDCRDVLSVLRPKFYFKSASDLTRVVVRSEAEQIASQGGQVVLFPETISNVTSTTALLSAVRSQHEGKVEAFI